MNKIIGVLTIIFLLVTIPGRTKSLSNIRQVDIVISTEATKLEIKVANQLTTYLKEIYPDYQFSLKQIVNNDHLTVKLDLTGSLPIDVAGVDDLSKKKEGFQILRTNETNLVIRSGSLKGLFNAVYSLLEKLGFRFYLSYDGKPAPKKELNFKEWEMSDYPLQPERIVFDWHNFLTGCTGWNYEDWCSWIDQSAKMRFNTIMVHAYGNNPMFSFEYNGVKKEIGYLTTSASGRDWGAQHINDVRRLPGGFVFTDPVLGSKAALVPDDQRGKAATDLMSKVFEHASEMAMKVNFAIDVDTWSANPVKIIESLPKECLIKLQTQDVVNPETTDGYKYYKAQVQSLLTSYPQITTITVWVRDDRTLWSDIKPNQFPKSWQNEWDQLLLKYNELDKNKYGPRTFAYSKIVLAFQKALKELKREDVNVAFGSWDWNFMPVTNLLLPANCTLIPLDSKINFETEATRKILREIGSSRRIIPIVWAHHDDHRYMGRPYTPYTNFNDMLTERNAAGFGIIHWTTRPLDLFFKSLADQVWSASKNKSIASTLSDYSQSIFGQRQEALDKYLDEWINKGPMFGRETTGHFFDIAIQQFGEKYEPTLQTTEKIKSRMALLEKVNQSGLSEFGVKMVDYDLGMEQFYISLYLNQDKFRKAYALLENLSIDSARTVLQTVTPEKTIELFAAASVKLPMTPGEKALIVSMGTRWLPDFIDLKQRARMNDVCYKFGKTLHDSLAQQPGINTYFIDSVKLLWSCLGEYELKTGITGAAVSEKNQNIPDNTLTYINIREPFLFPLVTIGKNPLTPGKYKVEIIHNSFPDESECRLILEGKNSHTPLNSTTGKSGLKQNITSSTIEIKESGRFFLEIDPGQDGKQFTNLIIRPI